MKQTAKFSFMEEWKEYKYTDIASLIGGGTPKTTEDTYWNGRIPWLSVKDFCGDSKYVYKTEKTITDLGLKNSSTKLLSKNDIIISARGTVGEIAMLPLEMAFNQSCFGIRANSNLILPDYLYYLTKTKVRELQNASHGSVFDTITRDTFENIICRIPPLEQQKQISAILSSIDSKIEFNRRINDNLEQQAQAWLNELLDRYADSTTVLIHEIAEINPKRNLSKGTSAKCIEMANLPTTGSFPNGWIEKEYNGGMKFCNGDTLIARITPCLENGKTAFINFLDKNEIAYGSTEYIVISAKSNYSSSFFYFLARNHDFVDYAVKNMNGSSGRQRVSGDTIGKYRIPVIPREKRESFTNHAEIALKTIKNNSLQNMRLSMIRDVLLPKLMSGELKVNDLNS